MALFCVADRSSKRSTDPLLLERPPNVPRRPRPRRPLRELLTCSRSAGTERRSCCPRGRDPAGRPLQSRSTEHSVLGVTTPAGAAVASANGSRQSGLPSAEAPEQKLRRRSEVGRPRVARKVRYVTCPGWAAPPVREPSSSATRTPRPSRSLYIIASTNCDPQDALAPRTSPELHHRPQRRRGRCVHALPVSARPLSYPGPGNGCPPGRSPTAADALHGARATTPGRPPASPRLARRRPHTRLPERRTVAPCRRIYRPSELQRLSVLESIEAERAVPSNSRPWRAMGGETHMHRRVLHVALSLLRCLLSRWLPFPARSFACCFLVIPSGDPGFLKLLHPPPPDQVEFSPPPPLLHPPP